LVPLLDLNAQNRPLETELKAAFERVLHSGQFIMGPDVSALESDLAQMLGVKHTIGVSSGTDALVLALMALDIGPGDEVLCPSFTFFATAGSIARVGATPVFVDSDPLTFNIDPANARAKISDRTRAIMPVHLYGQSADMEGVLSLAREHNLAIIEDAAQALGATYDGRRVGSIGTFGCYSFFPTKNLGALGDAGLLVSNDDALAEKARLLRVHGAHPKYYHKLIGGNFRLDSLQAAFLRVKLPHYADYTARRRQNAAYYTDKLSKAPGVMLAADSMEGHDDLAHRPGSTKLILPVAVRSETESHIWNQYTLRLPGGSERRDALRRHLSANGVASEIYYPVPLHRQECFAKMIPGVTSDPCPNASRLADEVVSIPIYPELTIAQLELVTSVTIDLLNRS
jgi:dTDP-4-amino-4,6-dideoxygalactose transaminase